MSAKGRHIVCLLALVCFCTGIRAQQTSVGLFSSPKGFRANVQFASSRKADAFHDLSLYADIYGVTMGKCLQPGIALNYTYAMVFHRFDWRGMDCRLYTGPGVSLGWVREHEPGLFDPEVKYFLSPGGMAAVNAAFGIQVRCHERVRLDLRWEAQAGVFYRSDSSPQSTTLSLFKNGIYRAIYPELVISILL